MTIVTKRRDSGIVPYCGMYLNPFDVNIVDHKQKKCPDLTSTKHEKDADDIYHEAYEKRKEKMVLMRDILKAGMKMILKYNRYG